MDAGPSSPQLSHRTIMVEGIRVHAVELGTGPLVLMIHGFPESWYSWRHQLAALAAAGYRAVAIDVRGYGRSSAPPAVDAYRMEALTGDVAGLLAEFRADNAVIVGHDWGAPIAWTACLVRPDLWRGLALLSVPYNPYGERRPTEAYAALGGDEEFYISYFQEPGRAEAEIEPDVRSWLLGFYLAASGDAPQTAGSIATVPRGGRLRDRFVLPDKLPAWLSEADLDFYVGEFERTGLSGGLNRYRNMDRDSEDLAAFRHRPLTLPSVFIGGQRDGPTVWGAGAIARFAETMPGLRKSHILPGCGHWIQQERAAEVNTLLLEFLASI